MYMNVYFYLERLRDQMQVIHVFRLTVCVSKVMWRPHLFPPNKRMCAETRIAGKRTGADPWEYLEEQNRNCGVSTVKNVTLHQLPG